jgi:adenine-specific DNA-methyltransferase
VKDCLAAVVLQRPNALILDFFAGSGTTLHATCLLNAEDNGQRRVVLVTNNEVDDAKTRQLAKAGLYRGDAEFEDHGIFSQVTRPRCESVISGKRPDGTTVPGKHIGGRPFSQGFEESVDFFKVEYLDADDIDLGTQFNAIHPSLWLAAGGVGSIDGSDEPDMLLPEKSPYAILFREEKFRRFLKCVEKRPDITHVWIVTDSEDAFAEMRSQLARVTAVSMLYRDYLRNFRINTRANL